MFFLISTGLPNKCTWYYNKKNWFWRNEPINKLVNSLPPQKCQLQLLITAPWRKSFLLFVLHAKLGFQI